MAFNLPSDEFGRPAQLPPNKVRVSPEAPFNVTASPSVQKKIVKGEFIKIKSDNYLGHYKSWAIFKQN